MQILSSATELLFMQSFLHHPRPTCEGISARSMAVTVIPSLDDQWVVGSLGSYAGMRKYQLVPLCRSHTNLVLLSSPPQSHVRDFPKGASSGTGAILSAVQAAAWGTTPPSTCKGGHELRAVHTAA